MHARSVIPSPGRVPAIQAPWAAASMGALLCMLCMCLLAAPAWAQKRMALVIGNGDCLHESRLNNPVNDARLIARTLRGLGFSVEERFNLGQRDMVLAINRFTRESSGADTARVYFAGVPWVLSGQATTVNHRFGVTPGFRSDFVGFRVVRDLP
ncbi:MAG: caspase family protein [Rubrivivax sp.]